MHRDHIDPPGLALTDGDRARLEVHVGPLQTKKITAAEPGHGCGEVPSLTPVLPCYGQQPGQLIVGQRTTHPAAVTGLVELGHHAQGVDLGPAGLDAPGVEGHRDLASEVDRAGGEPRVLELSEVTLQGIRGQVGQSCHASGLDHAVEVTLFLVDVVIRQAAVPAVGDVGLDVLAQGLAALDGEAVPLDVDDAVAAEGGVGDMLGQDPLGSGLVGGAC
ncbi:MAG: hypothetical protein RLN76_04470 [Phycisphaeraceae bacterium]